MEVQNYGARRPRNNGNHRPAKAFTVQKYWEALSQGRDKEWRQRLYDEMWPDNATPAPPDLFNVYVRCIQRRIFHPRNQKFVMWWTQRFRFSDVVIATKQAMLGNRQAQDDLVIGGVARRWKTRIRYDDRIAARIARAWIDIDNGN